MASSVVHAGQDNAVEVTASRADVAVFVRQGDDLLVALENGDVVTILDFYTPTAYGALRSLAFTDGPETEIEVQEQAEEIVGRGRPMDEDDLFAAAAGLLGLGWVSGPRGDDDGSEDTTDLAALRNPMEETHAGSADAVDPTLRTVAPEPTDSSDTTAQAALDPSTGNGELWKSLFGHDDALDDTIGSDVLVDTPTGTERLGYGTTDADTDLADCNLTPPTVGRNTVGQIVEETALLLDDLTEGTPSGGVLGGDDVPSEGSLLGILIAEEGPFNGHGSMIVGHEGSIGGLLDGLSAVDGVFEHGEP